MSPYSRMVVAIREALGKEPDLVLWPISPRAPGATSRTAPDGIADLCGILAPHGRWFALEVKTGGGVLRPSQRVWSALATRHGAFVRTVHSVAEARSALADAREESARTGTLTPRPTAE